MKGWFVGRVGKGDVHTIPVRDLVDHDERRDCWCGPKLLHPCAECDDVGEDCWRCEGEGVVPAEAESCGIIMVIHHATDGRV